MTVYKESKVHISRLPQLTVIAGGIGAGKSVVSNVLRAMGYSVYDCDAEARRIMDSDPELRQRIAAEVCEKAVGADGSINRRVLADAVFEDRERLKRLNGLVHGAVREDIKRFCEEHRGRCTRVFVETALLTEAGLDKIADRVWIVSAPVEVRIRRVIARNGLSREQVIARITAQSDVRPEDAVVINNDGETAILPQILEAIKS